LLKKYLKSSNPSVKKKDITDLIDLVTEDLEKTKFISDKFYSDSKAKNLIQRGSSINKIRNYLISKGIKDKYIKETISKIKEKNEDQDFFSAIKICKKKRIGPARDQDNRSLFYKKDISILARSGFDFETSKKVLEIVKDDYLRIINLL
jgi:regulatory protein